MLDVHEGRIAYAVLEFCGVLGMDDEIFVVTWRSLTLDADNECFVLDVDKEASQPGTWIRTRIIGRRWRTSAGPRTFIRSMGSHRIGNSRQPLA